jgi:phosphotriesterase-related protein
MKKLVTTLGDLTNEQTSMILPHEHVFVDLRTYDQPGYAQAPVEDVIDLVLPELESAKSAGIGAIVECSTVGVGRRADILKKVSEAAAYPLVVPTGAYREPWIPDWIHRADEDTLAEWMGAELDGDIDGSGVQAGWIKLSAGDNGLTECETKVLRAAARSARDRDAVIGSHTICGGVVRNQLDIIEENGYAPNRFIWIHAHCETDFALHIEMAKRGAWIEYDAIGSGSDETFIELILKMLDAGFERQLLLSQDRVGYDPAQPGGGFPKPYTYITETFLPKLRGAGVDEDIIHMIVCENPFRAFARQ